MSSELLPRAALALRKRASAAREVLVSVVEASSAAAASLESAASSLEGGIAAALPVPVFASLGLPAIAGCFRRAAELHREEFERIRKRVVAAADAAVKEWRWEGAKAKKKASSASSCGSSESVNRLRSRLTVIISAWKLQALLGPGVTVTGGKASVGSAGAAVAAELASVSAEMEGF